MCSHTCLQVAIAGQLSQNRTALLLSNPQSYAYSSVAMSSIAAILQYIVSGMLAMNYSSTQGLPVRLIHGVSYSNHVQKTHSEL